MPLLTPLWLWSYSLQFGALVAVMWPVLVVVARRSPGLRLAAWRSVLVFAFLLPLPTLLSPTVGFDDSPAVLTSMTLSMTVSRDELPVRAAFSSSFWVTIAIAAGLLARLVHVFAAWRRLRRSFAAIPSANSPLFEEACAALNVRARLVWHPDVRHPFTFGASPAIVVVPVDLASASTATQRAIFTHELHHVRRGDWRSVLVEEFARAALWFHPAVWLVIRELRQAREEVVDRATVALTGARRVYAETLVALAQREPAPRRLSLPFFAARQVPRRIAALVPEVPMSARQLVSTLTLVLLAGAGTFAAAARAFPLPALAWSVVPQADPPATGEPGPLEQRASHAPKDAPPPVRTRFVSPLLGSEAREGFPIQVDLRLVLDDSGRVAEARVLMLKPETLSPERARAIAATVVSAARQWRFEAPAVAPLALTTTLTFESRAASGATDLSVRERPSVITMKNAAYPDDARQSRVEGDVELEATIDATGGVAHVRVLKSPLPSMSDAAIAAIRQSTFRPGMKDGKPVPVTITLVMRFALK